MTARTLTHIARGWDVSGQERRTTRREALLSRISTLSIHTIAFIDKWETKSGGTSTNHWTSADMRVDKGVHYDIGIAWMICGQPQERTSCLKASLNGSVLH